MKGERLCHSDTATRAGKSFNAFFVSEEQIYNLPHRSSLLIFIAAPSLVVAISLTLAWPPTRSFGLWLLNENNPVEILTFLAAFTGSVYTLRVAPALKKNKVTSAFYYSWGAALFLLAMEEIAWGQHFFGFEPPSFVRSINMQDELTLHNLRGMQGASEYPQFLLGVISLVWLAHGWNKRPNLLKVPRVLLAFSVCIVLLAGGDFWQDTWSRFGYGFSASAQRLASYFNTIDELNELLIATFGFLFVWLNARLTTAKACRPE